MTENLTYGGAPGIGGSLGECALCGETFLTEIVLSKSVRKINVKSCAQDLYAHQECIDKIEDVNSFDVSALPEKSVLRRAYEQGRKA